MFSKDKNEDENRRNSHLQINIPRRQEMPTEAFSLPLVMERFLLRGDDTAQDKNVKSL